MKLDLTEIQIQKILDIMDSYVEIQCNYMPEDLKEIFEYLEEALKKLKINQKISKVF